MRIHDDPPMHLTYCLNVHPGETWAENFAAVREHAVRVRDRVCGPDRAFGLGLRLSRQAAEQLAAPPAMDEFGTFLRENNLYVFTMNGFPYGRFHDTTVKQSVYAPDWRTAERRDYTVLLADILAELLDEGVAGSISTVPGSYGPWIESEAHVEAMVTMLAETARHLGDIRDRTGREIRLALEPEPDCFLETADDAEAFVTGPLIEIGGRALAAGGDIGPEAGEELLRRHIGVCYDTAHAAVAFEDPAGGLGRLAEAGVGVGKVHLSSAMRLTPTAEALKQLERFGDEVYLHQVKVRTPQGIASFGDLPEALASAKPQAGARSEDCEWRVHFHVPLYFEGCGQIRSTSSLLTGRLPGAIAAAGVEHVEIETYTFGVLPADLRPADIADGIAAEYEWVLREMFGAAAEQPNAE